MSKKDKSSNEKPLEKMTAKELREIAKDIDEIQGAHAMNKEELLAAIRKARGIEEPKKKGASMREIKAKIKELRDKAEQAKNSKDLKMYKIYRKRALRLKKKTRRAV